MVEAHSVFEWGEVLTRSGVRVAVKDTAPSHFQRGRMLAFPIGDVGCMTISVDGHTTVRTEAMISDADRSSYRLTVQMVGRSQIVQDGRFATLEPGQLGLYDASRPYSFIAEAPVEMATLTVPHSAMAFDPKLMRGLTAIPMTAEEGGLGPLVIPFIANLPRSLADVAAPLRGHVSSTAVSLISALLSERLGLSEAVDGSSALLASIKATIETQLANPDLSGQMLADEHHISLRYLYRLFEHEGTTVGKYIKSRRIARACRDLRDVRFAHESVAAIGARWGFTDPARFSRVVRETTGLAPRSYRRVG